MRAALVLALLGSLAVPATAERSRWVKDRLGFYYQPRRDMPRQAGRPTARVAMFAARPQDDVGSVREALFVVALRDPEDAKIVVGGDADWISVAARAYSEVRGGKLVPHVGQPERCDDDDANATCYPGLAEYLRFARAVGWETAGAMYAIVRERTGRRFLIVGYAESGGSSDNAAAAARAKDLAFSVRLHTPN